MTILIKVREKKPKKLLKIIYYSIEEQRKNTNVILGEIVGNQFISSKEMLTFMKNKKSWSLWFLKLNQVKYLYLD